LAKEIEFDHKTGKTCYAQVRNSVGQIWSTVGVAFEAYLTANIANYNIAATEQGTASGFFTADFPTAITHGVYNVTAKERVGGAPAEIDITVGVGTLEWTGTVVGQRSNVKKNQALSSFEFMVTDSTTHAPTTGKTVTVTRSIDGGVFAAGTLSAVTEVSNGIYKVDFAAADLNGNVVTLRATATGCDDTFERIVTTP
jgi:hypothetical protein